MDAFKGLMWGLLCSAILWGLIWLVIKGTAP